MSELMLPIFGVAPLVQSCVSACEMVINVKSGSLIHNFLSLLHSFSSKEKHTGQNSMCVVCGSLC